MSYGRVALLVAIAGCAPPRATPGAASDAGAARMAGADGGVAVADAGDDGAAGSDGAATAATLRVHYPAGTHTLSLRGDAAGLSWNQGVALSLEAPDTWVYRFATLAGRAEWKPLVDDHDWSHGPNYFVLPGQTVDVWPHFYSTNGKVVKLFAAFQSQSLAYGQAVWAYLPASYDENTLATYPVLYMQDGQNLFDPTLAFGGNEWMVDETLDAASEGDGSIRELIVIGPEAGPARMYEYTPTSDPSQGTSGGGDLYLDMLVHELKPQVDAMLRTQPGRATTGLLGSSLGGLIAAYGGVVHPETFGIVGAMSPSTWWDNDVIIGKVNGMPASARPLRVYVDSGDSGTGNDDVTDTNMLAATYLSIGYTDGVDFRHVVQAGGQHNEIYWAQRLPGALAFLFGPRQR
jgi:predicted alpha/beta superfamily hydrolase